MKRKAQTKRTIQPRAGRGTRGARSQRMPSGLRAHLGARIRSAFEHHLYTLFASLGRLARAPLSSLMTMGVIAVALALPAAFFITLRTAGEVSVGWSTVGDVSVFLRAETSERTARQLLDHISVNEQVAEARLIDPATALEEFEQHSDLGEAVAALDDNPLPWVLVLRPVGEGAAAAQSLASLLEGEPAVDFAQVDMEWLNRFNSMIGVGQRAVQLIGSLLALGVLLIVGNTIRLDIENRREEIEVSKMLGGSNGFIRRPFLYSGFWYGVGGGVLALLLVGIGLALLGAAVDELVAAYGSNYQFGGLGPMAALKLLGVAGLIGWLGSWLAVSRHLAAINPR